MTATLELLDRIGKRRSTFCSLPICAGRRYSRGANRCGRASSGKLSGEVKPMSQQQLQQIIQMLKAQPIAGHPTVQETRANFEQMSVLFPVADDVKCEPVSAGGVKAEWVTAPGADPGRAVLYLHGGGYVIGSIATHRGLAARISRAAKARVLLIDYRLPAG